MVQTIQANLNLRDVKEKFNLHLADNEGFFWEWSDDLAVLTDLEKQLLDRVKANYSHLAERPMLENTVKMVVLSPLLDLAGFYQAPFDFKSELEVSIPIAAEDESGAIVRGRIDMLVLQPQFWVLVVESKSPKFDVMEALPQALAYMMASPNLEKPTFGLATNGREFVFIKLTQQDLPQYALSDSFNLLDRGNELYEVLRVLKRIGQSIL